MSRMALRPTQTPIQWVLEAPTLGVKWPGHEADLHLVPRLRMRGVIPPLSQCLHGVVLN